ncbi:MAG: hypothetical protein K2W95_05235 [Candidatus Obscuribacterales bacterium]|nr:hypothetical protein [Candidatus Obscuribacterales bacterium]
MTTLSCIIPETALRSSWTALWLFAAMFLLLFIGSSAGAAESERKGKSNGCSVALLSAPSAVSVARMNNTPDLMQSSPVLNLPWGGSAHCGPVAAANAFLWMAENGFDRLVAGDVRAPETSTNLVNSLARYMHTSKQGGTDVTNFLRGLEDYIGDRGITAKIRYQGWEEHPSRFSAGRHPSIQFIKSGLRPNSAAWIKIGWYTFNPRTNKYIRFAGHWVTVVAAGVDRAGKPACSTVVVHDPAPRSGPEAKNDFAFVAPVTAGDVFTGYQKSWMPAAGFLKIGGELKIKEKASCGLIDGVVSMEILAQ